jgi:putative N6-adenine-specific DNA methylase
MKPDEPEQLYAMIGSTLKHSYPGYSAWLITAGKHLLKHVGLKPKTRLTLFNGALECVLAGFELYEGSKKHKGQVMTGEI